MEKSQTIKIAGPLVVIQTGGLWITEHELYHKIYTFVQHIYDLLQSLWILCKRF